MKMKIRAITYAMMFVFGLTVRGDLIFNHSGSADPVSEGWLLERTGSGVGTSPEIGDQGGVIDAWSINDTSTGTDSLIYQGNISALQQVNIASNGWKLSVLIRVVDLPTLTSGSNAENNSIVLKVRPGLGSRNFDLVIGYNVEHDLPALIVNGINHWGTNSYSLIEAEYTAKVGEWGEALLTMSIDGTRRSTYSGASPNGSGSPYVAWGASASTTIGHAHWSKVTFDSLPAFEQPKMCAFRVLPDTQVRYQVTNIRRGVYYRFEKSTNLVDWSFLTGTRPNDYGDLIHTWPIASEKLFYRVGIK